MIARRIEGDYPGVDVTHGIFGWRAMRGGEEVCRAQSVPGLLALLPYCLED